MLSNDKYVIKSLTVGENHSSSNAFRTVPRGDEFNWQGAYKNQRLVLLSNR